MKNQIFIEYPMDSKFYPKMVLMEKNILASILNHEAGKQFIRPIFKAFFPQIEDGSPLIVDDVLANKPVQEDMLREFDGLIAYTTMGDYYLLNVHSKAQCIAPTESALKVIDRYKKAIRQTAVKALDYEPHFYYLGLLPNKDEAELVSDPNGRITIGSKGKDGQDQIEEVLNIHFEAIRDLDIFPFQEDGLDTKWIFFFQEFGDPDFRVLKEKGNKVFLKFFETVRLKLDSHYFTESQKPVSDEHAGETGPSESLKESIKNKQADHENTIRVVVRIHDGSKVRTLFDGPMIRKNDWSINLN